MEVVRFFFLPHNILEIEGKVGGLLVWLCDLCAVACSRVSSRKLPDLLWTFCPFIHVWSHLHICVHQVQEVHFDLGLNLSYWWKYLVRDPHFRFLSLLCGSHNRPERTVGFSWELVSFLHSKVPFFHTSGFICFPPLTLLLSSSKWMMKDPVNEERHFFFLL